MTEQKNANVSSTPFVLCFDRKKRLHSAMMHQPMFCPRAIRLVLFLSMAGVLILSCIFLLVPALHRRIGSSAFNKAVTIQDGDPFDITKRTDNPPFTTKDAFVDWMLKHTDQDAKFLQERWDLSELLRRNGDFTHERVREAFLRTPREYFCRNLRRAYECVALPIGYGQTISAPDLVAHMTSYLNLHSEQKVLEIGTGSGYQSAVLSELSNHVYTIEIIDALARETNDIFKALEAQYPEYRNIQRKVDDGYYGWPEYAPFDSIIVTCATDHVPPPLISQLAPDGIMIIPIGPPFSQTLLRIVKKVAPDGTVSLNREDIYHGQAKVIFVPLTAPGGATH
jgi:protein-L-isoaspartate(D-aspartate) O-methyltransferase